MSSDRPIRAVLIAGPTASGKSALALALAEKLGGVVVNADASQVYADLRVLSARPSEAEERRAPHRLYGHVDAAEPYGVGRWLDHVRMVINELTIDAPPSPEFREFVAPTTSIPIIVGGTGLYLEALISGLSPTPEIPPEIRERWRATPRESLHAELAARDPVMAARLRPSDSQRLMRALEVIDATGRSLAEWQAESAPGLLDPADCLRIALAPDRAALDVRIAARLDAMIEAGAQDEAVRLTARGLDAALPAMKALGVSALSAWARGEISRAEAIERTRLDTRRYAKRQSTWFRNRMADWIHVAPEEALARAEEEIAGRGVAPL